MENDQDINESGNDNALIGDKKGKSQTEIKTSILPLVNTSEESISKTSWASQQSVASKVSMRMMFSNMCKEFNENLLILLLTL